MGVKKLLLFLRQLCGEIVQVVGLEEMRGYRIALDLAVKAYAYKSEYISKVAPKLDLIYQEVDYNETTWFMIRQVLKLCSNITAAGCCPVGVFDGKAPELKSATKKDRGAKAQKNKNRIAGLRRIGRALLEDQSYTPGTEDIEFLRSFPKPISSIDDIRDRLLTEIKQHIVVTADDYQKLAAIFANVGLPYVFAQDEAEKTCAIMARHRDAIAALTTDSDCLIYGCPIMIEKLQYSGSATVPVPPKAHCYSFANVLKVTGLTNSQFIEFCIMCGTDFNPNPPGFGPDTSLELLLFYGSLTKMKEVQTDLNERLASNPWLKMTKEERILLGYDFSVLNYDEVRCFLTAPVTYDKSFLKIKTEDNQYERCFIGLTKLFGADVFSKMDDIVKKLIERLKNLSKVMKH
jgi:flap endonuclease-1